MVTGALTAGRRLECPSQLSAAERPSYCCFFLSSYFIRPAVRAVADIQKNVKKFWCPAPQCVVRWNEKIGLNFRSVRPPAQAGCAAPQADKKPCFCGASCVFRQMKGAMPTATNLPAIRAELDNRLRRPDGFGPCPDTHENPPGLSRAFTCLERPAAKPDGLNSVYGRMAILLPDRSSRDISHGH